MNDKPTDAAIDSFLDDVRQEIPRAIKKFPMPNPNVAALSEEAGEVTKATLHIREGKSACWWDVYEEAVQCAAMACRVALEGDPTLGAVPTEDNCK